jgi:hypothetical protein
MFTAYAGFGEQPVDVFKTGIELTFFYNRRGVLPISPERRFVRQRPCGGVHRGLVIPANAKMKPEIARTLQHHGLDTGPPSEPPHRFSFHYVDAPIDASLLEDGGL